uniref:Uncharacterized protein n=1 Tax=Sus scrofa TaxID=9823 RepID=A0A4X1W4S5_PIG
IGLTALSSEKTASLIGQLRNIAKKENCVVASLVRWIRLFLKCCLVRRMQESLLDFPGGFIFIKGVLMHHNQQVFSPCYDEILRDIILPAQAQETQWSSQARGRIGAVAASL